MISSFRKRQNRGSSALLTTMVSVILGVIAYIGTKMLSIESAASKRVGTESKLLVTGHALASLFKQELLDNFSNFGTLTWADCRTTGGMQNFLAVLSNPNDVTLPNPAGCRAVEFTLTYLVDEGGNNKVRLDQLQAKTFRLSNTLGKLNGIDSEFKITDFNLDAERNLIIGELSQTASGVRKTTRMAVDLQRTLAAATPSSNCKICRTTPGSVCCAGKLDIAYLEAGTGRIMDVSYDITTATYTESLDPAGANPLAISVKNLATTPTYYKVGSFCVPSIQPDPIDYIVDAATKSGSHFYLTSVGTVLEGATVRVNDPKIMSISFHDESQNWLLLRSDGKVLKTTDIADVSTYEVIPNLFLPRAESLVVGSGPAIAAPCS